MERKTKSDYYKKFSMKKDIKNQFPIFQHKINGYPFIYFDSASTAQVPDQVIDALACYYESYKSNVGRGIYHFAEATTQRYEDARKTVAEFIGAESDEIIFTSGATAGINMVALSWAQHHLQAGDEIIISEVEHHSNFLPWQQLAQLKNLQLKILPVNDRGVVDLEIFKKYLSSKTKLVALVHTSNLLGTTNLVAEITKVAQSFGARVLIDAAQSVAHRSIDVKKIGCDFLVFSGHKIFGPTGIGVLFTAQTIIKEMKPYIFGGGMVFSATENASAWRTHPHAFEAGTPLIAGAIGLAQAIKWMNEHVDFREIQKHETNLVKHFIAGLHKIKSVKIVSVIPQGYESSSLVTFYSETMHAHDVAAYLDSCGIAVRAGNHCTQPYHDKKNLSATIRVSFSFYNSIEEVDFCLGHLKKIL
jgi:cysteine desulfurase/selenocysteine lyase